MSVGGGLHSFDLTESREGVEGLSLNVRLTQGVAHHVIGVVVDVLVGRAVDIEDVGAPLTSLGSTLIHACRKFFYLKRSGRHERGQGGDRRHDRDSGGKHQPRRRSLGRQTRLAGQPGPEEWRVAAAGGAI
jgi:hypothetical protein